MTSGAFHYRAAEAILAKVDSDTDPDTAGIELKAANVHAMLALAAVHVLGPISEWAAEVEQDAIEWAKALGSQSNS